MDRPLVTSWGRALLGLGTLGLALAAGIDATASRWRAIDPDRALRVRPGDAVALTLHQDQHQAEGEMTPARAAAVAVVARRALRSEPLTAAALRQIAVAEGAAGRHGAADRLVQLSYRLTRRELGTSWLLIEGALDRGDAAAVARHFDEALTATPLAGEVMYPALSAALFDPGMQAALAPYVRQSRPWMPYLMRYALGEGDAGEHVGSLVVAAGGLPRSPIYDDLDRRILNGVAAKGEFDVARAYLRTIHAAGLATDPRFSAATTDMRFGPFAWSLADRQTVTGRRDDTGRLQVRVSTARPETVAARTLVLPAGRYRFSQKVEAPDEDVVAAAKWEMRCLPGDRRAWSLELPVRRTSSHYAGQLDIPADCKGQQLALIVAGRGDQEDAEIIVDSLELSRQ